jgi:hypothetical protein
VPFPAELCSGPPKDFEIKFMLNNERNKFSFSGKGTRHFNPLEDYRFFHHWFSGVKTP